MHCYEKGIYLALVVTAHKKEPARLSSQLSSPNF